MLCKLVHCFFEHSLELGIFRSENVVCELVKEEIFTAENFTAYIDMPLYWYRVNNASATKSKASWRKTDLLTAVKRIEAYLVENNCGYSGEFNSYMYARAMWAVAKTFAVSGEKELYKRLIKEFDVKNCMKRTAKDNSKIVALASKLYLIRPMLFYHIVRLKK